ncbi:MAG: hypothetical protein JEY91_12195 [Spirochaetaceae bacterium]|nr:hypothetical protein [Spirochaetaceae bacterium]
MASLLERAKQVREVIREEKEIEAIPLDEREAIYKEIDRSISSGRLRIRESTFSFEPEKNDQRLPVLVNGIAFLIIIGLSLFFYIYFNRVETFIVTESETIVSAESALVETLKEESQQRLNEKEQEILSIQNRLEEMRRRQETLQLTSQEETARIEKELRSVFEAELESERVKLQNEGFSTSYIEEKLQELEAQKDIEFNKQIQELQTRLEEEHLARDNEISDLISSYEANLQSVLDEQIALENSQKEQLEGERDKVLNDLANMEQMKKQEDFILGQIVSLYSEINRNIQNSEYDSARENLVSLEDYLNLKSVSLLPAVKFRRDVDIFMIHSLRKLIDVEIKALEATIVSEIPLPEIKEENESDRILAVISEIVEQGNFLYEQGDLEAARESYLQAISYVPALDAGYLRLQEIEKLDFINEEELFTKNFNEGNRSFDTENFEAAITQYQQALQYLAYDSDSVSRIVNRLVEAGLEIETAKGNSLVSSEDLTLINEAKIHEQSRNTLIDELNTLERKFLVSHSESTADSGTTENLVSLLGTKLLIKEVLASDSIREEYPDLHEKMELYLEAYGKEKEKAGRDAALSEIVAVTEVLSTENTGRTATHEEQKQKELFLQFLDNLKSIIEAGV